MQSASSRLPGSTPGRMEWNRTCRRARDLAGRLLPALAIAFAAGCGGGGGGGDGPTPTPSPRQTPIPVFTPPQPTPAASSTPPPAPGVPQVLLSEGETVAGDLRVNDIREAALAPERTVAVIIRASGSEARAVIRRREDGSYTTVFDATTAPPALDLTTLEDLEVSSDGAILFRGGDGIDTDQLYFAPPGSPAVALAGASPGVVAPEFRVLGDQDLGLDGEAAFVGGGNPCMTDEEGSTRCDVHLYLVEDGTLRELAIEDNDLKNLNPRSPRTVVAGGGVVYFSVRGTGEEPVLVRATGDDVETLFSVDTEISGVGGLINPTLEGVGPEGQYLVTTALREEEPPRPLVLGVLALEGSSRDFTEIARVGTARGTWTVVRIEVLGIDDQGAVLYLETLEPTDSEEEEPPQRLALRLFDGATSVDVAVEEEKLPGSDEFVIELRDPHFNRRGEVALVAELGDIVQAPAGPTITIRGTDVLVRSRAGVYSVRLPAEEPIEGGLVEGDGIADFGDDGTLLALGSREDENDELLLLVPPPDAP